MKKIFVGFCFIIITSCAAQKNDSVHKYETFLISDFKSVYLKRCLKYGYNNSNEVNMILAQDKSNSMDFALGIENYKLIDSLSIITAKKIKKDSTAHPWKKTPDSAGKRVFKFCLDDYTSKWLDSLAKSRFNK